MIERKASRKQHRFLFSKEKRHDFHPRTKKRILFCPGEGKNDVDKNKKFIPTPVPQPLSSFPFSLSLYLRFFTKGRRARGEELVVEFG